MTESTSVRRRFVDDAVVTMLREQLGFPVGLGQIPDGVDTGEANVRYAILFPQSGAPGATTGPPASPEADVDLDYDVRVCTGPGLGRAGCQWGSDEVRRVFFSRSPWGAPIFGLDIDGHEEMGRSAPSGIGAATLLDGVWQATDSITITVTRSS